MADLHRDIQYSESSAVNVKGSWVVKKFSELQSEHGHSTKSEYFKHGGNITWRLELYPGGIYGKKSSGRVLCFINFGSVPTSNLNVKLRLSVMDTLSRPISSSCGWDFQSPISFRSYRCGSFGKRNALLTKLVDDTLIISIDVCFSDHIQNVSEVSEKLILDYIWLWKSGRDYDVTLIANGISFPAHSIILSTRSNTFDKRIRNLRQIGLNSITISEFDEDAVTSLLQFIYSSTVNHMDNKKALDLLRAAEEYEMFDLKAYCSGFLMRNFSVDNICEVIIAADKYDDKILKEKAIEYICKNNMFIDWNKCLPVLKEKHEVLCEILKEIE